MVATPVRALFQSARQIIGFPKVSIVQHVNGDVSQEFQSARQIIGFPKIAEHRTKTGWQPVSICKADYWLPQV